jgi:hypothetical protein
VRVRACARWPRLVLKVGAVERSDFSRREELGGEPGRIAECRAKDEAAHAICEHRRRQPRRVWWRRGPDVETLIVDFRYGT